jgi:DNA-binding PadR family transcriptional regulator
MSSTALNPLSHLVLALVGRGGAGPHDLVEMMRLGGRLYWAAAPSKLYAEPKRLRALGYLDAARAPGRTRDRTVYSLTESGERALREWIAQPSSWPRIQHEAIVRVLAGDIADDAELADSLAAMRAEIDELDALHRESLERAAGLPHRERYLEMVHALGRRLIAAHREWIDDVEAALRSGGRVGQGS